MEKKDNIVWFVRPSDIRHIIWEDLKYPCEETVNFENDGDGHSKYIWAYRKKDNRFMKVGKVIKNYVFLPFIFGLTELMVGITWVYNTLNNNSVYIEIGCLYSIMFLIMTYYILSDKNVQEIPINRTHAYSR